MAKSRKYYTQRKVQQTMRSRLKVGRSVSWVGAGLVARVEGRAGKLCTSKITEVDTKGQYVTVAPLKDSSMDGHVISFDQILIVG